MKSRAPGPDFATLVQEFFCVRLIQQRDVSARTVESYRDTVRLLLDYLQRVRKKPPTTLVMSDLDAPTITAFLDHLELFGMGYSWGGYESLLIPAHPETCRTATPWRCDGVLMRIHVGLEDPDDLIADLEAGFARLRAAG